MVRRVQRGVVCAGAGLLAALLATEARACDLRPPETGTVERASVAAVLDGETLKLIGAKAPAAPLAWRGDDPWLFVEEAKEALEALPSAKAIELRFGGSRTDRHGYLLAQAFVVTGERRLWLQEELVARGLARVYSLPDNRACMSCLRARKRRGGSGRLPPIASKTRPTRSVWDASFIPISSSRERCSTWAKAMPASI